jgi:two-component system, chemotaxis family, response regulator PixH
MRRPQIQVIDENTENCIFIVAALQRAGYEVHIALNGQDGLARVMTFQPQCLILNARLPDMSGYAVCRFVRQIFPQHMLRIILISARNTPIDQIYAMRQGADRHLQRPFSQETLIQTVWEVLPEPFHSAVSPDFSTPPFSVELTPYRNPDTEAMRAINPFAQPTVLEDERVRRLYEAIDGRKTIVDLANASGLETREVLEILDMLRRVDIVQVYDSMGHTVASDQLLPPVEQITDRP